MTDQEFKFLMTAKNEQKELIDELEARLSQSEAEKSELVKSAHISAVKQCAEICKTNLLSWASTEWNGASKDCAKKILALLPKDNK